MHGSADEGELAVHVPLRRVWLLQPFERQRGCRREPPVARYGGVVYGSCDEVCHARRSKRVRWPVRRRFIELPHLVRAEQSHSPTPPPTQGAMLTLVARLTACCTCPFHRSSWSKTHLPSPPKWLAVVDGSITRFTSVPGPLRANSRARGPLGIIHEELGIPIKIRGAIVVPCFTQLNRPRPVLHGRIIFAFLRFCSSSVLCRMRWSCFHSEPRVAILRLIFSCLNQIPSAYNRNEVFIVTIACLQVR
jgi:hypothetical protein